jgi:ABC-type transport system substrate-binding protein
MTGEVIAEHNLFPLRAFGVVAILTVIVPLVTSKWCAKLGGNSMTQRHTNRSRVLRKVGAVLAASLAVSTLATTGASAKRAATGPTAGGGGDAKVAIFDTFGGWCGPDNLANSALMAARTVYETLFEKSIGGDMVPMLAESGSASADLKTWTIKIRSGIKMHDGTALDASLVKYNYDSGSGAAVLTGATGSKFLGTAVPFLANVLSSTADDAAGTVVFKLFRPQNDFLGTLYASGRSYIRARAQIKGAGSAGTGTCGAFPIGSGPFKVEASYVRDADHLKVVRNPDYWRKDARGVQLPYLNSITFDNIKDSQQRKNAISKGKYDAAMFTSGEGKYVQSLRANKKLVEFKSKSEYYPSFWFNQKIQPQFANIHCRKAVSFALDRKTYVRIRTNNEATAADSVVGATSVMYSKTNFQNFSSKKAKDELALCKTETGKATLEFTVPADTSAVSYANVRLVQSQLAAQGITMSIKQEESYLIIGKAFNAAAGNQYDAIIILLMEGTDVSFNLPFLVSNSFAPGFTGGTAYFKGLLGSILNLPRHTDTKVDDLLYAAQALPNGVSGNGGTAAEKAAVKAAYKAATDYIQDQAIITCIAWGYYNLFASTKMQGVGKLKGPSGKTQRVVTNWGIDWTGVYLK